jgi:hypothetical protein
MMSQEQMHHARSLGDKRLKPFNIPKNHIRPLIPNMGACFATDRILIDGLKVGYMYREESERDDDSGWVFLAGDESQEYLDDQWNLGIYSVNTICNYDPEIIPLIHADTGSAFERHPTTGKFEKAIHPQQ